MRRWYLRAQAVGRRAGRFPGNWPAGRRRSHNCPIQARWCRSAAVVRQPGGVERQIAITDSIADPYRR